MDRRFGPTRGCSPLTLRQVVCVAACLAACPAAVAQTTDDPVATEDAVASEPSEPSAPVPTWDDVRLSVDLPDGWVAVDLRAGPIEAKGTAMFRIEKDARHADTAPSFDLFAFATGSTALTEPELVRLADQVTAPGTWSIDDTTPVAGYLRQKKPGEVARFVHDPDRSLAFIAIAHRIGASGLGREMASDLLASLELYDGELQ